jgi:tRNA A-37 threonylcarbamoyl transferase component Bud32
MNPNLAPDDRLPHRDLLLDAAEVARRLSLRLGLAESLVINSCDRVRTKYRYGQSLRVLHRIRVGKEKFLVAARMFAGTGQRSYEAGMKAPIACGPLRPITHDPEIRTVFWTFPNDRKITSLESLNCPPEDLRATRCPQWTRSRLMAYTPEKCATAECLDDEGKVVAYAKVYGNGEGLRVHTIYRELQRLLSHQVAVQIPRVLGYSEAHGILLLEVVNGNQVCSLASEDRPNAYHKLGVALASLHSLPTPVALGPSERLTWDRLKEAARVISAARPDVRREVANAIGALSACDRMASDTNVFLHGDLHPKNGILSNGQLALIDFDQAAVGSAAVDMGGVLAGLSYNQLTGLLTRSERETLSQQFLDGYSSVRHLPTTSSLQWHAAAALIRERALRAITRVRLQGLNHLREVLTEALSVLHSEVTA